MPGKTSCEKIKPYDYILVGAGSASCLIASRLSKILPDKQILVLEAGEHIRDDPKVLTPGRSVSLQSDSRYDWQYVSEPEPGLKNRRVKHPRGKLVGGTSAINSHSVVFPNHEWQDRIASELLAETARTDWSSQSMKDCYARWQVELPESSKDHSNIEYSDRVRTSFPDQLDFLQSRWIEAFEELGHTTSSTGFAKSTAGAVTITNAIDSAKAERSHAGTAFLEPALRRGNVTVKTGIKVNNIIFDESRSPQPTLNAQAVRYIDKGEEHVICGREIILCAGVFESPAILQRSGIGSKEALSEVQVPVLYELPGVGENLQDHLNCSLSCEVMEGVPTRDNVLRSPKMQRASLLEYEQSRTGRLAEGPAYSFAFTPLQMLESPLETNELTEKVKTIIDAESNSSLRAQYSIIQSAVESPDEATATTFMLRSQRNRDLESLPKGTQAMVDGNYVTAVAMLAHPFSRGSCHIVSSDPTRRPKINFNYLSHPLDVEIFARHLRLIERLFQSPTFTAMRKPDGRRLPRSFPHPVTSLADAKNILPINSATNYHPCGTCSMMREDLGGVVDEGLRVYGTANVRICDASILPIIPRGNILAAVYAFAEKAAEIIIREASWAMHRGSAQSLHT